MRTIIIRVMYLPNKQLTDWLTGGHDRWTTECKCNPKNILHTFAYTHARTHTCTWKWRHTSISSSVLLRRIPQHKISDPPTKQRLSLYQLSQHNNKLISDYQRGVRYLASSCARVGDAGFMQSTASPRRRWHERWPCGATRPHTSRPQAINAIPGLKEQHRVSGSPATHRLGKEVSLEAGSPRRDMLPTQQAAMCGEIRRVNPKLIQKPVLTQLMDFVGWAINGFLLVSGAQTDTKPSWHWPAKWNFAETTPWVVNLSWCPLMDKGDTKSD